MKQLADVVRQSNRLRAAWACIQKEPQQEIGALLSRHVRCDVRLGVRHDHQVLPNLLPQTGRIATNWHQFCSGRDAAVCGNHVSPGVTHFPHVR